MSGGRPTKYKPEYCQKIIDYFNVPLTERVGAKKEASELPMLIGFAMEIGVSYETILEWTKVHEEFSHAYKSAKRLQEKLIAANAMNNRYNAYFAQFMLKNNHGWKDKQEVEQTQSIKIEIDADDE